QPCRIADECTHGSVSVPGPSTQITRSLCHPSKIPPASNSSQRAQRVAQPAAGRLEGGEPGKKPVSRDPLLQSAGPLCFPVSFCNPSPCAATPACVLQELN